MLNTAFALAVDHERVLCGEFTAGERATLLELLGRVGAQLGLAEGAHSGDGPRRAARRLDGQRRRLA
jgi:hypothetical protein